MTNISPYGSSGKPRNVKAMSVEKLRAILDHPGTQEAFRARCQGELRSRGIDVGGRIAAASRAPARPAVPAASVDGIADAIRSSLGSEAEREAARVKERRAALAQAKVRYEREVAGNPFAPAWDDVNDVVKDLLVEGASVEEALAEAEWTPEDEE